MTEAQLYEKVGRQAVELETRKVAFTQLLKVFAEVVSGECERSRLLVNLTDETYTWAPPGERPAMPATINGVPQCVMAPDGPTYAELQAEVASLEARLAEDVKA